MILNIKRVSDFTFNKRFVITLFILIALVTAVKQYLSGSYNNYKIYKYTFWHTLEKSPLYDPYPSEYADTNHYGPAFALMFYGLLAFAVLRLKRKGIIQVKVTGYPLVPIILLLFSIALTINTIWVQPQQSMVGIILVLSGVPFYYYFKKQKTNQGF